MYTGSFNLFTMDGRRTDNRRTTVGRWTDDGCTTEGTVMDKFFTFFDGGRVTWFACVWTQRYEDPNGASKIRLYSDVRSSSLKFEIITLPPLDAANVELKIKINK